MTRIRSLAYPSWIDPAPWSGIAANARAADVMRSVNADDPGIEDLAILLSNAGGDMLEPMAQRAQALTRAHFGKTISLYAPLYLSDYCTNGCTYCGFASDRRRTRRRLEPAELRHELHALETMGIQDILLLTGERTATAGFRYVLDCVEAAAERFPSVAVETFGMDVGEYRELASAGCTGVTLYQETYDPVRYAELHRWGPKRDYQARLDLPSRVLEAGIRTVGMGVLFGLADPVADVIALYRHAMALRKAHWRGGVSFGFPRVCAQPGGFVPPSPVDEAMLARIIFALRIVLPDMPLVMSTRESRHFRDGIAGVGISKMSVASRTSVGGYGTERTRQDSQFEINDTRSVADFCAMLRRNGLDAIFKDWDAAYR